MRSKFKWIFTLLVAFTMQFSFAQQKTVTGVVSDDLGPVAGANVVNQATKAGTVTDFDGNYSISAKKGDVIIDTDEIPRADTTTEALAKLPTIFKKGGSITAGSSSALCDAGSASVIADSDWAKANGFKPEAEILSYASGALDAVHMGLGPTVAMPKALEKAGLTLKDMDIIEINEAFAVQILACHRKMPFDMDRLNPCGGAIALGHPIGASGMKILATLLYSLKRMDKELGIVSACIGGGQGVAMVVRRL